MVFKASSVSCSGSDTGQPLQRWVRRWSGHLRHTCRGCGMPSRPSPSRSDRTGGGRPQRAFPRQDGTVRTSTDDEWSIRPSENRHVGDRVQASLDSRGLPSLFDVDEQHRPVEATQGDQELLVVAVSGGSLGSASRRIRLVQQGPRAWVEHGDGSGDVHRDQDMPAVAQGARTERCGSVATRGRKRFQFFPGH